MIDLFASHAEFITPLLILIFFFLRSSIVIGCTNFFKSLIGRENLCFETGRSLVVCLSFLGKGFEINHEMMTIHITSIFQIDLMLAPLAGVSIAKPKSVHFAKTTGREV